jgi:two-component system cell cycle sensor histidine kinase/response regulator CckA
MQKLEVLIVEDNPDDAELVLRALRQAGFDPHWSRVETEPDFMAALKKTPQIILSDYSMPSFSGLRALELSQASGLNIPLILISGTVGEDVAVEAMRRGSADYLLKDRLARLGSAVERVLNEQRLIAERKELEAQFVQAQKMEVIGQLSAGMAHDFNNILAVIIGYGDLMLQELRGESTLRNYTAEIRHAADRASALTRQLLVFSRKQASQAVVFDLNAMLQDLDKMLRRLIDENVELTMVLSQEAGRVKADAGYIGQVLMNLVVNARDAMPNGGKLTITTSNATLGENVESATSGPLPGRYVVISVSDTGTGMTAEVQARLFEPFFTTKPKGKGTGLGLVTCQAIVRQCGGKIDIFSKPGQGATFRIYIPRVDLPLDSKIDIPKKGVLLRGTETILLVEDEPSVRHLACNVLEGQGYHILPANNGKEGLQIARDHKGPPIELVVTDVIMPQMSGRVMAEWLKALYPKLRILFTSGYTDDAVGHHAVLEPGVAFLPKPYTPASLAQKVRDMLDHPAA